jgi:hypothetical protein
LGAAETRKTLSAPCNVLARNWMVSHVD